MTAPPASADIPLIFGVYAADKPSAMVDELRPTLNVVERELPERIGDRVRFKMQILRTYGEGIDALLERKVDVMRLGPVSYVKAKEQEPGLDILAVQVNNGEKFLQGAIVVHNDSDIRKVGDLRGRSFAFGDELSTIGRYVPQYYLSRAGITNSDLSRIEYLGRHDRVGTAVASRQFDAGSLETTMIVKLVAEGAPLRVLTTFRSLPRTWVARAGLDARLVAALALTLIEMRDPTALKALRAGGFLAAEDADYEETREAIRENDRFFADTAPRTN